MAGILEIQPNEHFKTDNTLKNVISVNHMHFLFTAVILSALVFSSLNRSIPVFLLQYAVDVSFSVSSLEHIEKNGIVKSFVEIYLIATKIAVHVLGKSMTNHSIVANSMCRFER